MTLDEANLQFTDATILLDRLKTSLQSPAYEPPVMPAVAIELLQLSKRPDVSFADIRRVMEKDPMIAARVLRIAQSSAYTSNPTAIRTLEDALVRLGLGTLSQLFLETAMRMKVFRVPGFDGPMAALGRHSAAVAHVARHVSRRTSMFDEYSFLCGLLHDVGIAASLLALAPTHRGAALPVFDEVWWAVRAAHEMASDLVFRAWKLPADLALVVAHHHQPVIGGHVHPVAALLSLSDWVAAELGFAIADEAYRPPPRQLAPLGLAESDLAPLVAECKAIVARVEP